MYWLFSWQFERYYTDQGFELFASLLFLVWLSFEFGLFVKVCFNKAKINVMFFRLHGVNMNKFSKTFDWSKIWIYHDQER